MLFLIENALGNNALLSEILTLALEVDTAIIFPDYLVKMLVKVYSLSNDIHDTFSNHVLASLSFFDVSGDGLGKNIDDWVDECVQVSLQAGNIFLLLLHATSNANATGAVGSNRFGCGRASLLRALRRLHSFAFFILEFE